MSNENNKPLSSALKIFYGVGDCGFTLMSNVESYFFAFFLTNLAKFDLGMVGIIQTVFSLVDACLSWMYGVILNTIKPGKWGRYRTWLVLITWLVPILYMLQFSYFGKGKPGIGAALLVIFGGISSHIVWNFPYVANVSMIAVAGKTPEDRAQLAATRAAWANLSKILFTFVGAPLAAVFAKIIGETNQYAAVAFVLGVVMFLLYFCHFKMFEGYETVEAEVPKAKVKKEGSLISTLVSNPPLIFLILSDLAKWMFNFVCMGFAVYYFTYVAGNAAYLATYMLISNILCIVGSYVSKFFAKALSTRTTTIVFFILMAACLLVANFMYTNMIAVVILMSVAQFGYGVCYAATPALYADTIIYAEWKTGKNATGFISGLQNVPLKVSILLRGVIITACLAAGAFSAEIDPLQASDQLKKAICLGFMVIPAVSLIIAAVLLLLGFRLTKDKVEQYTREIAARKAAA